MQTSSLAQRTYWEHRDARGALLDRLLRGLSFRLARQRQRKALGRLDDRLLADIGVSRQAAEQEAAKPIWRD